MTVASFDALTFLVLARQLVAVPSADPPDVVEEARLRSAISRAYYAAFWHARMVLVREGERLTRLDAHQALIEAFRSSPYRTRKAIGAHLELLRTERNMADYQRSMPMPPSLRNRAERAIALAEMIVQSLDSLSLSH